MFKTVVSLLVVAGFAFGHGLPEGFSESQIATGLQSPTRMAIAPDGRIFVTEQTGAVRVIVKGKLLPTPVITLNVDSSGERGLDGIVLDPDFSTNGWMYLYYTALTPAPHNRVARFTVVNNVAQPGTEVILMELEDLWAPSHNGGAMEFGPDGKLYIAVGDNYLGIVSQLIQSRLGKIHRINKNGSIPTDNPFYDQAPGDRRSIWALGLRNPFSFSFQPGTGRMFINDVGNAAWEEINEGIVGGNYGWPFFEGFGGAPYVLDPVHAYSHGQSDTTGCSIVGSAFYNPSSPNFPPEYIGRYFFADYCSAWIRWLDPATGNTELFATDIPAPVDLRVGPDGSLYYLSRGSILGGSDPMGLVGRITFAGNDPPQITSAPASTVVSVGSPATFTVGVAGTGPFLYQWLRNGAPIPGANSATLTIPQTTLAQNGQRYRVLVANAFGSVITDPAYLAVTTRTPAVGFIVNPPAGFTYQAGTTLDFSGVAWDPVDGFLPPSAFKWRIDFHHDTHFHPFMPTLTGVSGGSVIIPNLGEVATNVWYRIHLTVTNSAFLETHIQRDIHPQLSTITLETSPPGLRLSLDSIPITGPHTTGSVTGMARNIGAPSPQMLNGKTYRFVSWSNGGQQYQNWQTPPGETTLTAVFEEVTEEGPE